MSATRGRAESRIDTAGARGVGLMEHGHDALLDGHALLGLSGKDAFCLAAAALAFALGLSLELLVGGESRGTGAAHVGDERADALSEVGRELGNGG